MPSRAHRCSSRSVREALVTGRRSIKDFARQSACTATDVYAVCAIWRFQRSMSPFSDCGVHPPEQLARLQTLKQPLLVRGEPLRKLRSIAPTLRAIVYPLFEAASFFVARPSLDLAVHQTDPLFLVHLLFLFFSVLLPACAARLLLLLCVVVAGCWLVLLSSSSRLVVGSSCLVIMMCGVLLLCSWRWLPLLLR